MLGVVGALGACGIPEGLRPSLKDAPTHERYTAALSEFGLDQVALGQDWLAAASLALTQPLVASTPFAEKGYLPPERPTAVGYRLELARGRRFAIDVVYDTPEPGRLFIDLFEVQDGQQPRRVGGAEPGETRFEYDVRRTGAHVLRLQPELLRGGRYSISMRTLASYQFPLKDRSLGGVSSGFGDPRDGGARDHHGIDIFAPRGTPVLAGAEGVVRVDETPVGGRVIWLRDARAGRNLYYAHLHDWAVTSGARVRAGDVIGYVGNTGNARTTPPHLHFGIYDRGPSDPAPYLYRDDPAPPPVTAPVEPLGDWMRVARASVRLRPVHAPPVTGPALERNEEVRVMAARRGDYRVWLRDGTAGLLRPQDLRTLDPPSPPATAGQVLGPGTEDRS
jgi:murein DD-endopeptidase MepM/ murein hydrolase activator NlpD